MGAMEGQTGGTPQTWDTARPAPSMQQTPQMTYGPMPAAPYPQQPAGPSSGLPLGALVLVLFGAIIGHVGILASQADYLETLQLLAALAAVVLVDVGTFLLAAGAVNMALRREDVNVTLRAALVVGSLLLFGLWLVASSALIPR